MEEILKLIDARIKASEEKVSAVTDELLALRREVELLNVDVIRDRPEGVFRIDKEL